ncbi:M50 family metallopeptidase [Actinoplanes sp. CA-131856]
MTAALLAWVLAVPLWYVSKFVVVIAHEAGHALLAVLLFRAVKAIRFERTGAGSTEPKEALPWLVDIFVTMAGYLGPSMFGLAGTWMLLHGHIDGVLWASLAFLLLMLIAVRGIVGWLIVPGLIVLVWMMATKADGPVQELYAHMWVWLLLIGAVQRMLVFMTWRDYTIEGGDADVLRRRTLVPREIWAVVFLAATVVALVWGGGLLLRNA